MPAHTSSYTSAIRKSDGSSIFFPTSNAGSPLYGHPAHRNASPKEQLPHPPAGCGLSNISCVSLTSGASPSARPQVQLAHAFRPLAPTSQSSAALTGTGRRKSSSVSSSSGSTSSSSSSAFTVQAAAGAARGLRVMAALVPVSQLGLAAVSVPAGPAAVLVNPERSRFLRRVSRIGGFDDDLAPWSERCSYCAQEHDGVHVGGAHGNDQVVRGAGAREGRW